MQIYFTFGEGGGGWNIITLSLMNLCMFFSQQCNHLVWVTVVQYLYWLLFRTTECRVSVFGAFARCHNERRQLCTELDLWVLLAGGITLFSQWRNTVLCVLPGPSVEQDNPSPPFFQLTMQTPVVLSTVCGTSQERPARTTFFFKSLLSSVCTVASLITNSVPWLTGWWVYVTDDSAEILFSAGGLHEQFQGPPLF